MSYSINEASQFEYETFKRGREGWQVIVCQVCLNSHYQPPQPLALDGVFGAHTESVAKEVQRASHVVVDGIVGLETQTAFTKAKLVHAQKGTTPPGLLAGIAEIESSYSWACVSPTNEDGSHDYGVTQVNYKAPTEAQLLFAFNPDASGHALATEVKNAHDLFVRHGVKDPWAWSLAALNHNWPVAAEKFEHNEEAWLDKPFPFATKDGYKTGLEYCEHYIEVATAQVTSWTVS